MEARIVRSIVLIAVLLIAFIEWSDNQPGRYQVLSEHQGAINGGITILDTRTATVIVAIPDSESAVIKYRYFPSSMNRQ